MPRFYPSLVASLLLVAMSWSTAHAFVSPLPQMHRAQAPVRLHHDAKTTTCLSVTNDKTIGHEFALLFDCDGVILETEELHRRAYNTAFNEFNLTIDGEPVVWDVRKMVYD